MEYPVLDIVPDLKTRLQTDAVVILQAPPGAGKSTVLPLELMPEPWLDGRKIIMLEPRRLAAKAVAERMADTIGERCGEQIGYRIRFDTKVSNKTRIEVVTEGILTRMLQQDSALEDVGLIIFDEFHERSLHADLSLALSLQAQHLLRPDLRILIMSATLDGAELSSILGGARVLISEGRQFPVSIRYDETDRRGPVIPRVAPAVRKALQEQEGDILVFLPGAGEIRRVFDELADSTGAMVYPLYGDLSFQKQQEAILPSPDGTRKIVLATSIAETSLTIQGIRTVIDSGLARVPRFDPRSGLTRLETVPVTKDAAEQRAGRAGRLSSGVCYRLWTAGVHQFLAEKRTPEILEADLASLVLELMQWGVRDPDELTWITPPPKGSFSQAKDLLTQLEAVEKNVITRRGREMLRLPTHPRVAHMLLLAREESDRDDRLVALATDIAAILEERDPLDRSAGADLTLRIEALRKWRGREKVSADKSTLERVERTAANWRKILSVRADNGAVEDADAGKLLWAAYPERVAQQQGKYSTRYKLWNGRMVSLPPADALVREPWICVAHLDAGTNEGKAYLAAPLHLEDLAAHATESVVIRWDDEREMVTGALERRLGPLLLESRPHHAITDEDRVRIVLERFRAKGLSILGNPEVTYGLQARIMSLFHWRKQEDWPPVTEAYLKEHAAHWLTPFLGGITKQSELNKLEMNAVIRSILPWELEQKLDILAPEKMQVPSGSMIRVKYNPEGTSPVMEVRLQEMFGLAKTPTVNEGKTPVLLHLLSPGFKPVQVTQDLQSFWQTAYHDVRKELRMRYPKHRWPEDPWNAQPVRGTGRRSAS